MSDEALIETEENESVPPRQRYRRQSSVEIYLTFMQEFMNSKGGWQLIFIAFAAALGLGSTMGVIPQVTTQGYAEVLHNYEGESCSSFVGLDRPAACIAGGEDAQNAASYATMGRNIFSLLCNSVAGGYSDIHGRKGVQIISILLLSLSPLLLIVIQVDTSISPTWYFAFDTCTTMVSFSSVAFSSLSDILPERHRAASFGLFMGAFFAGFSIGPLITALIKNHLYATVFSFVARFSGLLFVILMLPETLPEEVAKHNKENSESITSHSNPVLNTVLRPLKEMVILGRNRTLILITIGCFLSKFVFSADISLFYFYVENVLGVRDKDVAGLVFTSGIAGILVQAVFLKYLISLMGEHRLLVTSFISGVMHNLVYGLARTKLLLYVGMCMSHITGISGPLLSSAVSRNVEPTEQGRSQGALSALTALAEAIGPVFINYVYRNWHFCGKGTMFVVAAFLYLLGTIAVFCIPSIKSSLDNDDDINNIKKDDEERNSDESTPLLDDS